MAFTIDAATLENALKVASDKFKQDAEILKDAGLDRTKKHFERQAETCQSLADELQSVDGKVLIVSGDEKARLLKYIQGDIQDI